MALLEKVEVWSFDPDLPNLSKFLVLRYCARVCDDTEASVNILL